jgi:hypothetical protein
MAYMAWGLFWSLVNCYFSAFRSQRLS